MAPLIAREARTASARSSVEARTSISVAGPRAGSIRRAVAVLSLLGLGTSSLVIVLIAAERPSFLAPTATPAFFPEWMTGPLGGLLPGLTRDGDTLAWLVSALMAAMYGLYVLAFTQAPRLRARWTIATVVAIHAVFFLAPPLQYTDVFNYINYGRMGVLHHLNPYTTIPQLGPHSDPSFALSNWHFLLSPYGPLFTLFTYALVPLGVSVSFWALKLVIAITSLTTLALVWRSAELLGRSPTAAVVFVGCNPLVLVWGLGADHNDVLMLFFVVLAVYLSLRAPAAPRAAGIALVSAVFIKAPAAVLVPIFLVISNRGRFARGGLQAGAVLGIATVITFGFHVPDLATQGRLVTSVGIPNLLGLALGQGGETRTLHLIFELALLLLLGGCAVWAFRRREDWLTVSAVAMLALSVSLSWSAPWYLLWALPFAALSRARHLRSIVLVLGVYFLLVFMPAAFLLADAIHFRPESTALGIEHRRQLETLVR